MRKLPQQYARFFKEHMAMTVLATVVVVFFLIIASVVTVTNIRKQRVDAQETVAAQRVLLEEQRQAEILAERIESTRRNFFSNADLIGRAAIVYDVNTGETLFEKNADSPFALASITKVMTAIAAQGILPAGTTITIDETALATRGESDLILGEIWNFSDLADLMLIASSNDASTAIAYASGRNLQSDSNEDPYALFIDRMNQKAREIGLDASFQNSSGLDLANNTLPSAVGSPRDVAKLFSYALSVYPEILNHSRFGSHSIVSLNGRNFRIANTNDLTRTIDGLLASKTGFTLQAGGNLAIVVDVGFMRPVVIVVLGSTREGRFSDVEKLYTITKEYYRAL
jgi:D-alanyl-D-alanine carboxypeptidase (penicillin-binding protein 5/6)